jgi:Tfp pilus assembly protein PilP
MKRKNNSIKAIGYFCFIGGIMLMLIFSPVSTASSYGAEPTKVIKPPIMPTTQTYSYRWLGRSDPFKPFMDTELKTAIKMKEAKKEAAASSLPISPLQRLDLGVLRVVGIAGDERIRKAVIEDSQKKFYPIRVGTFIGANNGMVKEILADRIIIEEKAKVAGGKIKVNLITMKLHTSEDEGKP